MTLELDNVVDGRDLEGRIANLLRALSTDNSDAADAFRWLAKQALRARRGLVSAAMLPLVAIGKEAFVSQGALFEVIQKALEVDDE